MHVNCLYAADLCYSERASTGGLLNLLSYFTDRDRGISCLIHQNALPFSGYYAPWFEWVDGTIWCSVSGSKMAWTGPDGTGWDIGNNKQWKHTRIIIGLKTNSLFVKRTEDALVQLFYEVSSCDSHNLLFLERILECGEGNSPHWKIYLWEVFPLQKSHGKS